MMATGGAPFISGSLKKRPARKVFYGAEIIRAHRMARSQWSLLLRDRGVFNIDSPSSIQKAVGDASVLYTWNCRDAFKQLPVKRRDFEFAIAVT